MQSGDLAGTEADVEGGRGGAPDVKVEQLRQGELWDGKVRRCGPQ